LTLTTGDLESAVAGRLSGPLLDHVVSVVETAHGIASRAGWPGDDRRAVRRAAWLHDAVKDEGVEAWIRRIREAGEEPDPWSMARAPILLHAHAAAIWGAGRGENDPRVLAAVRHHPTAHPGWGPIGRLLYVADFCEPRRPFAASVGAARIRRCAAAGETGLANAAREVLRLRLARHLDRGEGIHPLSLAAWNSWTGGEGFP